jgi:hypothetical protein
MGILRNSLLWLNCELPFYDTMFYNMLGFFIYFLTLCLFLSVGIPEYILPRCTDIRFSDEYGKKTV